MLQGMDAICSKNNPFNTVRPCQFQSKLLKTPSVDILLERHASVLTLCAQTSMGCVTASSKCEQGDFAKSSVPAF